MKLSNTVIINETLLPSNKKAFTLAEVLITLSILGIVAALTIPSLVNRQSDMAAIVKLKKAISTYEQAAGVYMVENEATDFSGAAADCDTMKTFFKVVKDNDSNSGCIFTTGDGALWIFTASGNPVVMDSARKPRFAVTMYAEGGEVNATGSNNGGESMVPASSLIPRVSDLEDPDGTALTPQDDRYYSATTLLNSDSQAIIAGTGKAESPRKTIDSTAGDN